MEQKVVTQLISRYPFNKTCKSCPRKATFDMVSSLITPKYLAGICLKSKNVKKIM